ncbi:DUF4384 [Desulfonema limicola]|uniref:DUF4384 n=1 Tax=Desulfonema limicola TaxID=45656 RepID=A0A975GHT6_9BACT|nr:caspase family protein [Desulfonema limicola]QTA81704.1 DUF4384 [Desulfonema limicola]
MKKVYLKYLKTSMAFICYVSLILFASQTVIAVTGPSAGKPAGEKYALLIGIDKYTGSDFKPLQGAKNDVKLIKEILVSRFNINPENITMLLDENADHDTIKMEFENLAQRLNPEDMVYIHYSGHGSYTCDLNGDEDPAWAKDSTWVSYGTRSSSSSSVQNCGEIRDSQNNQALSASRSVSPGKLKDYDILDDEIHNWLASLEKKTSQVIFVSDSCHSGTVSRGEETLMTRGIPIDMRPHPLGTAPASPSILSGLRVTACLDSEKANEYNAQGVIHGLFTWFWAQSLQDSHPGQTWKDLYNQTCARIRAASSYPQHPQIEGNRDQAVFGGQFKEHVNTIPVTYVSYDGKEAKIGAGTLTGVTKGSVFRKYDPDSDIKNLPSLEIIHTEANTSKGRTAGTLKVGDMMTLETYQHNTEPLKIMIRADSEKDKPLADKIRKAVTGLSAYEITANQNETAFVIQILRPKKKDGNYIYKSENDTLPQSFEDQPAECWVLNEHEHLYNEKLKISAQDPEKCIKLLCDNLSKIAKVKNLTALSAAPGQESFFDLNITIWHEAPQGITAGIIEVDGKRWQKEETVNAEELEEYNLKSGSLLTFSIYNKSERDYYVYLINITSDGDIIPFYPPPYQSPESAKVRAGYERRVEEVTLQVEKPKEYVRLIASLEPIDIYILNQKGFENRSESRLSPIEELLIIKAGHTRGKVQGAIPAASWTTVQGTFNIE